MKKDEILDKYFHLLLLKVKELYGIDFSQYRLPCLKRRIDTRLRFNKLKNHHDYLRFLETSPSECEKLLNILTINLSEFFRDKDAWNVVQNQVIPDLLKYKEMKKQRRINIWSAGTSAGEEAYTLAILLAAGYGSSDQVPFRLVAN